MSDGSWSKVRDLARPRLTRGTVGVAVVCAGLGFATVLQVRSLDENVLERSRRTDLVQILEEVSQRSERLEQEAAVLQATRDELRTGAGREETAREEARERAQTLAVLNGTSPVSGPGIILTYSDPDGLFGAAGMLGAVQELRAADAEAISIQGADGNAVRVVVSTSFVDAGADGDVGAVVADGQTLRSPYRILAIGDAPSLAGAMRFPRGVIAQVTGEDVGGTAAVQERETVTIEAVAPVPDPAFASPQPLGTR